MSALLNLAIASSSRSKSRKRVTILPYVAFLNPFFIIIALMIGTLVATSMASSVPFSQSSLWTRSPELVVSVLAIYGFWTIRLYQKTSSRAIIVNSYGVFLRFSRRRIPLGDLGVESHTLVPFGIENVGKKREIFPFSHLLCIHEAYFSLGFFAIISSPISDIVRLYREDKLKEKVNVKSCS